MWKLGGAWVRAMKEQNFAIIADWFTGGFLITGGIGLILAGIAAGFDKAATAPWQQAVATGLRIWVLSSLFAAASTVGGWLLGLLFGIPRSLARANLPPTGGPPATASGGSDSGNRPSRVNTNLEDISDWLTKTIVGVGLTQLFLVPHYLWSTAQKLNALGFQWDNHGPLLALSLFFFFAPGGFWLGYIGTRTILTMWLDAIDSGAGAAVRTSIDPDKLVLANAGIGIQEAPDPSVQAADRLILSKKLQELTTPREIAAWAAAQARKGNLEAAQIAIDDALQGAPDDADIKKLAAVIYSAKGRYSESDRLLGDQPQTDLAVFNSLYQPPPEGFTRAIQIGERLLTRPGQEKNANLHVWMACAYGQQYRYEQQRQATPEALAAIKEKVLREIRAALAADPNTREWLHSLWQPAASAVDNDLNAFPPNDPDLTALLGP